MGGLNAYLEERAHKLARDPGIDWKAIDGATILITGATGLIGSQLARTLGARFGQTRRGGRVILPVRSPKKARGLFGRDPHLMFTTWEAGEPLESDYAPRYVIHGAGPTQSRLFVEEPVEVMGAILDGTRAALELSRSAGTQKMLLLSTMEVYGAAFGRLGEGALGPLDPMEVRSCYPEAKRAAECLVAAYASEYDVPACVVRLAQTFGEGVEPQDGRAFAQFARRALAGEDVVLLTTGEKKNPYLSVDDAVRALLTLLVKGEPGRAYNAANEATYVAVRDLAQAAISTLAPQGSEAQVTFAIDDEAATSFRPPSELDLDTTRLRELGWEPMEGLPEMFSAMAKGWELADE